VQFSLKRAGAGDPPFDPALGPKGAHLQRIFLALCFHIDPPDDPIPLKYGKNVIPVFAPGFGNENLNSVVKAK
jgi:hypothetical protein